MQKFLFVLKKIVEYGAYLAIAINIIKTIIDTIEPLAKASDSNDNQLNQ